jgi:hypothetical protein
MKDITGEELEQLEEWERLAEQILEDGDVYRRREDSGAEYEDVPTLEKWMYALDTVEARQGQSYEHPLRLVWSYATGDFEPVGEQDLGQVETSTRVRDRSAADKIYREVSLHREGRQEEGIKMGKLINKRNLV